MGGTVPGAPPRGARVLALPGALDLTSGKRLERVEVTYETFGTLEADGSNAVLICHALSGDSHVTSGDSDRPGWWEPMVGPGKAIDTEKLFVICTNVLGGCSGTTGPASVDPATGRPY
ncbi:MAG: homoserine O-acetyltransferase, partial [Coriobacteriaceae bacterium]|nr:homoserine O-acetyltransferase [Coriobacteriaceae bacterium]